MALIFLYRTNGGQVQGESINSDAYDPLPQFFSTVTDPSTPDGTNLVPPKIYDGTQVRSATAAEIMAFAIAEAEDDVLDARDKAKKLLIHSQTGKVLKAIIELMVQEINTLRSQHGLSPRTRGQVINAINNAIDAGDVD